MLNTTSYKTETSITTKQTHNKRVIIIAHVQQQYDEINTNMTSRKKLYKTYINTKPWYKYINKYGDCVITVIMRQESF